MNDKKRLLVTVKDKNELFTEDEILKEFKRKIRRLYNIVTDSFTMNIEVEALTMLTTGEFFRLLRRTQCVQKYGGSYSITLVESRLVDLIAMEEDLDQNKVRDVQREIERQRRNQLHEEKLKNDELARLARNLRAHERSMQTQKIKSGRRLVKRSAKPYQRKKARATNRNSKTDDKDDDAYYFTLSIDEQIALGIGLSSNHSVKKLNC